MSPTLPTEEDVAQMVLPPDQVLAELDSHDRRMDDMRRAYGFIDAAYNTEYWQYTADNEYDDDDGETPRLVETNRVKPQIEGYVNALFPKGIRPKVRAGATGRGDAQKTEAALGEWLSRGYNVARITMATRQAKVYDAAGAKVRYRAGEGDPIDRCELRIFPCWELMLDTEVHDPEDARFVGHVGWYPLAEVEADYGLSSLKGQRRPDFLADRSDDEAGGDIDPTNRNHESKFVRVLELCNLRDPVTYKGETYKGRLEVWILGQDGELSERPHIMRPLSFENNAGEGIAHIVPLIFDHRPAKPLQGRAYAHQLMPQVHELNLNRAALAEAAERDVRYVAAHEGVVSADSKDVLREGRDMMLIELTDQVDKSRPPSAFIEAIRHAPFSPNRTASMEYADQDLTRVAAMAGGPNAQGTITRATAEEVARVGWYADNSFGHKAMIRDMWLREVLLRVIQAMINAMHDVGASDEAEGELDSDVAGLDTDPAEQLAEEVAGAATDALTSERERDDDKDEDEDESTDEEGKTVEESTDDAPDDDEQQQEQATDDDVEDNEDEVNVYLTLKPRVEPAPDDAEEQDDDVLDTLVDNVGMAQPGTEPSYTPQLPMPLIVRDPHDDSKYIEVTAEDLSGDFRIGFVDAGRSPADDSTVQQFLGSPLLGLYNELIGKAFQGGPEGALAEAMAEAMAETYRLPQQLDPGSLLQRMNAAGKPAAPPQAPPGAAPAGGPPGPPAPPQGPPQGPPGPAPEGAPPAAAPQVTIDPEQAAQLLQMPPAEALAILAEAIPDLQPQLAEVAQLPPEAQVEAMAAIVNALAGGQ